MTRFDAAAADVVVLRTDADVVLARHRVRDAAVALGMDLVTQTKIITASSELARNTIVHGGGGTMDVRPVHDDSGPAERVGLQVCFHDDGPGIADVDRAMTSGWTSGTGLGLGLPGARRLVNEFELRTAVDAGTDVSIVIWHRG